MKSVSELDRLIRAAFEQLKPYTFPEPKFRDAKNALQTLATRKTSADGPYSLPPQIVRELREAVRGLAGLRTSSPSYGLVLDILEEVVFALHPVDQTTVRPLNHRYVGKELISQIRQVESVHPFSNDEDVYARLGKDNPHRMMFVCRELFSSQALIGIQVALTPGLPANIGTIIGGTDNPNQAPVTTATFYSISNWNIVRKVGKPFITEVVRQIVEKHPDIENFVTLSPMRNFGKWVREDITDQQIQAIDASGRLSHSFDYVRRQVREAQSMAALRSLAPDLEWLAAFYQTGGLTPEGHSPVDAVAKFHLGNGAEIARVAYKADESPQGFKTSLTFMTVFRYSKDKEHLRENARATAAGKPPRSQEIVNLLNRPVRPSKASRPTFAFLKL